MKDGLWFLLLIIFCLTSLTIGHWLGYEYGYEKHELEVMQKEKVELYSNPPPKEEGLVDWARSESYSSKGEWDTSYDETIYNTLDKYFKEHPIK